MVGLGVNALIISVLPEVRNLDGFIDYCFNQRVFAIYPSCMRD